MAPPSLVIAGHVTKDLAEGGTYTLGGGATFAALAARALGYPAAVLTRAAPDIAAQLPAALPGIEVRCLASPVTTTFRNEYLPHGRRQQLLAISEPLFARDVPPSWRATPLVLLAPVAGELGSDLGDAFAASTVGVSAQGLLRERGSDAVVRPASWRGSPRLLRQAAVVIFSEEDVADDEAAIATYAARARLLVVTRGARGATVYSGGTRADVPAFAVDEKEPTGAGDVFATAFLIVYNETHDPLVAARFANCAASFVVEQAGTAGIPSREQVLARLGTSPERQARSAPAHGW